MTIVSAETVPSRTISVSIFDPAGSIFKHPKNVRANCNVIKCRLKNCNAFLHDQCVMSSFAFVENCPYGEKYRSEGPTPRSRKYSSWIKINKEKYFDVQHINLIPTKLIIIGDYIYLPYSHINMCKSVPFVAHSSFFYSGCRFIPINHWTLENVIKLIDFHPQSLMGGEILNYQKKEVPKFLIHLREEDTDMWEKLIKVRPNLDIEKDYIGRRALVMTLKPGIEWDANVNKNYPVHWRWNGSELVSTDTDVYSSIWGGSINAKSIVLTVVPKDTTTVKVQDNDWVTSETVFID